MKHWVCSKCSSRNRENMKFCHICHIPRPAETLSQDKPALPVPQPVFRAQRFTAQAPALHPSRSFGIMKLIVLLNLEVMFASLVTLVIVKGG